MTNGRRAPRRRRRRADDDRPRGYEPTRMRRVWEDIDHARERLGLGQRTNGAQLSWPVGTLLDWAVSAIEDASTRLNAIPEQIRASFGGEQSASACGALARGVADAVRQVPLLGRVVSWLPIEPVPDDPTRES